MPGGTVTNGRGRKDKLDRAPVECDRLSYKVRSQRGREAWAQSLARELGCNPDPRCAADRTTQKFRAKHATCNSPRQCVRGRSRARRRQAENPARRARGIAAAREFVRTRLNAPGDKALTDALLSEDEFANIGYVLSGQKNTQAATMVFEWLVELHPDSITGRANLAYFYGMSGKTNKAIEEVKKAMALSETDKTLTEEQKKVGQQQMEDLLKMLQTPPAK